EKARKCGLFSSGAGFGHISPTASRTASPRFGGWNRRDLRPPASAAHAARADVRTYFEPVLRASRGRRRGSMSGHLRSDVVIFRHTTAHPPRMPHSWLSTPPRVVTRGESTLALAKGSRGPELAEASGQKAIVASARPERRQVA